MLKQIWPRWIKWNEELDIYTVSSYLLHKVLIITKVKKRGLEDISLIKQSSSVIGQAKIMCHLRGSSEENTYSKCASLLWISVKMHNLNWIMEKQWTNQIKKQLTNNWLYSSEVSRAWKAQTEACSRWKETKRMWQQNTKCDSDTDPFAVRGIMEQLAKLEWSQMIRWSWYINVNLLT